MCVYCFLLTYINECVTGEHNCDANHAYCNNTAEDPLHVFASQDILETV